MRTILITGAASGIGAHLACEYNKLERVVACDINEKGLKELPEGMVKLKLDVSKAQDWESVFQELEKRKMSVDILVNAAGVLTPGNIDELDPSQIERHMDINVKGLMRGCRLASIHMRERRIHGSIVNIGSLAGIAPIPGLCLYSASKFAVRGFTLAIAGELRAYNIHVGLLSPDAVRTPMLDLQRNYKEAALTFSGGRYLEVQDIKKALDKMIKKRQVEIAMPHWRSLAAKIASAFPGAAQALFPLLARIGRLKQKHY